MHFSPLAEIVILFLLSILVNLAASKIRLPATVGFLLTGVLCGPSVLGLVSDKSTIDHVADLGVAMLMFTIGMELSGDALNRLKKPVFVACRSASLSRPAGGSVSTLATPKAAFCGDVSSPSPHRLLSFRYSSRKA